MEPSTLLLWDIDGTLVSTGRAGELALIDALREGFGRESDLAAIEIAGRTDRRIAEDVLLHFGIPSTGENLERFLIGYLDGLVRWLHERRPHGAVLPGVETIVSAVAAGERPGVVQGLLTGNLMRGAELKLKAYGLWHHFPFGAFADDSADRNELGPHAKRRAEMQWKVEFDPRRIFVIGDTPHDVACGKVIGAQTVAVATGRYPAAELAAAGADHVFENLAETATFWDAIG